MFITWQDVTARYPELDKLQNGTSQEVRDGLIAMAEAGIHARLAAKYSVPFTSANYTAKDLAVDLLYIQTNMTRVPEKAAALKESLDERIAALLDGNAQMVTVAGTIAAATVDGTVWSDTMTYPPTFGMSDIEKSVVSSERLYDEDALRGDYR